MAGSKLRLELLLSRRPPAAEAEGLPAFPPGAVSFVSGSPDPHTFPVNDLVGVAQRVLRLEAQAGLQDGGDLGPMVSREILAQRAKKEGSLRLGAENVLLTHGSRGALQLIGTAFLDPGDLVLVEGPTRPEALRVLRAYRPRLLSLPVDEQGLQMRSLAQELARLKMEGRSPKLLYTMPSFQNPTGSAMPLDRRQRLAELAHEFGFLVVEDNSYAELRYEGEPGPSLLSLDRSGGVLAVGTCGTVLAPGLRVGWIVGGAEAIGRIAAVRADGGAPALTAALFAEYARLGLLEHHIANLTKIYRSKRDTLLAALAELGPPDARWTRPSGGFFVWLKLPAGIDPPDLLAEARREEVGYLPGRFCFADGADEGYLRLSFSRLATTEIREGIRRLARAMEKARR